MEVTKRLALLAKKKGILVFHQEEIQYARFREDFKHIPRGTVIVGNRVIYGYPHIGRIFTLRTGLKNITSKKVSIEEKIDGYNVRVALVNKEVIAFSRGGFIDPFATEKVQGLFDSFFKKFPTYVLCGEMIGNTPYTPPTRAFDVKLFMFDIDRGDGTYVPVSEKQSLFKKFNILAVPLFGTFDTRDYEGIKRAALSAFKDKKEGIVLKSENSEQVVKFVNPHADISDIARNTFFFDMPQGFYMQRILRSAFFIKEFALDHAKLGEELGTAFFEGLTEALKIIEKGDSLTEEFEITIKDPLIWKQLRMQMGREVGVEKLFERKENEVTRIRFRKIYKKTTKRLREFLHGKRLED